VDRNPRISEEVANLLDGTGLELVDVETTRSPRGPLVRVYVDKPAGVTIEDCVRLTRALEDHFEAREVLPAGYVLEVSSPGIDRPLPKPEDIQRFRGESAQVATHEKIGGRHHFTGVLVGFDEESGAVILEEEAEGRMAIPWTAVKKANLKRDPWAMARGKERSRTREKTGRASESDG
jgi:ribosome maturation factor RimP